MYVHTLIYTKYIYDKTIKYIYKIYIYIYKTIKSNLSTCYTYDINPTIKTMKKKNFNLNRKEKLTKHWFRCDSLHSEIYL